jgi:hypothetical protein
LSDDEGRRGAVSRKVKKRVRFDTRGGHQEEEQEGVYKIRRWRSHRRW